MTEIVSKIGLQVVLEGLGQFGRDMQEVTNFVKKFSKSGEEMERTFKPVNKLLSAFFESLKRIGEFVVAGLIVRGFEKITSTIRDMVGAMITSGMEFQTLTVRLEGLLAREILDAGQVANFTEALELAGPAAEDLFFWIQQLALTTPFDIQDVAETITFAKAYGFAADQAKIVTAAIVDFASGMGLSSVQMKRIIENFGQMIQQGKVTNTELRDLGRGALVPTSKILERMRENLGLTTEEFQKLRSEGKLEVMPFIDAFIQTVGEDFPDAGIRASKTLRAVIDNLKDFAEGILGFNVVMPILDVFSGKIDEILKSLVEGERGKKLVALASQIGEALAGILGDFLGTAPGGENIADWILEKLDKIKGTIIGLREIIGEVLAGNVSPAQGIAAALLLLGLPPSIVDGFWEFIDILETARSKIEDIVQGFKEGGLVGGLEAAGVSPAIITFVEKIQEALENIALFWDQNKGTILPIVQDIFGSLLDIGEITGKTALEIIGDQIVRFSDNLVENGPNITDILGNIGRFIREDLVPAFEKFSDWLIENQDMVVDFLVDFRIGLSILQLGIKIFVGVVVGLVIVLGFLVSGFAIFVTMFIRSVPLIVNFLGTIYLAFLQFSNIVQDTFASLPQTLDSLFGPLITKFSRIAYDMVFGFAIEFGRMWNWFTNNVSILFNNFVNWLRRLLGISSPSKVFEKMGRQTIEGYAKGIMEGFKLPEKAMGMAIQQTLSPAIHAMMPAMAASNVSTTNNFALNVNSSARTEPVVADFRMLQSLVTR